MHEWEQNTLKRYELWKNERTKLNVHVFVCSVAQLILITLLFTEAYDDMQFSKVVVENADLGLLTAKAICSTILHCSMNGRISQGCDMMKYALNHHMKFLNYSTAFELGLMRVLTSLAVETISLILIFTQSDVQDVVFNFIALAVIDDFDVFVYDALRSDVFKQLLSDDH